MEAMVGYGFAFTAGVLMAASTLYILARSCGERVSFGLILLAAAMVMALDLTVFAPVPLVFRIGSVAVAVVIRFAVLQKTLECGIVAAIAALLVWLLLNGVIGGAVLGFPPPAPV